MTAWMMTVMIFSAQSSAAVEQVATIKSVKGVVKRLEEGSIKKVKVMAGDVIQEGDMIITYQTGQALIELLDGSKVVVDEGAKIRFPSISEISQEEGAIYYEIIRRSAQSGLKIRTPFAIIGIKGTIFVVNAGASATVSLKEGVIGIATVQEAFELHRKRVLEEYERFKMQQEKAFEAYKQAQQEEIVEYVREFELEAGKTVFFSDNRADVKELEPFELPFEHFEQILQSF